MVRLDGDALIVTSTPLMSEVMSDVMAEVAAQ
jgi:hypothetical protein